MVWKRPVFKKTICLSAPLKRREKDILQCIFLLLFNIEILSRCCVFDNFLEAAFLNWHQAYNHLHLAMWEADWSILCFANFLMVIILEEKKNLHQAAMFEVVSLLLRLTAIHCSSCDALYEKKKTFDDTF